MPETTQRRTHIAGPAGRGPSAADVSAQLTECGLAYLDVAEYRVSAQRSRDGNTFFVIAEHGPRRSEILREHEEPGADAAARRFCEEIRRLRTDMRQLPYDIIARDVRDLPDEGLSAALDYLKGDDEAKKLCDRVWRERQDMRLRRLEAAGYRLP